MESIEFFVPGDPVGRDTGQTADGRHYTTAEGKRWRETIAGYALACPNRPTGQPCLGPVTITAVFLPRGCASAPTAGANSWSRRC